MSPAVEAIGFFVDDGEQLLALCFVEVVIGEQAGDGGFDTGEWSAQFVSDGIEQNGAEVLALVSGLGLRKFFHGAGPFDGDSDHAAQGLKSGAGERRSSDANSSSSARAQM